jgi:hypothetical protein
MALITCVDCNSQISDAAPACPKCGRPVRSPARVGKGGTSVPTFAGIGLIGLGVYLFFASNAMLGAVIGGFGCVIVVLLSRKSGT